MEINYLLGPLFFYIYVAEFVDKINSNYLKIYFT